MSNRALKLCLCLSLALPAGGCGLGRYVYYAATLHLIKVPSAGMSPTIKPGDMAAVDLAYYEKNPVRRFEIVTYRLSAENIPASPGGVTEEETYVGRVVGLGGEKLEIRGGRLLVDGRALEESFARVHTDGGEDFGPVEIADGEYFLLGDNRPNSLDSRYWARPTLKKKLILGRVVEIFPQ